FFFLEMNTRLQVEHPVTELVHDVDLVRLQIAAAEADWVMGWSDPPSSHAIEVRLYAEDPANDYQPQSGRLTTFDIPRDDGIRVDAGFETGSEVSTHYDAMLAKVIAHAPTREAAARKLASVLSRAKIHGVRTNRDLLVAALRDPVFLAGDVSTDFDFARTFDHGDPGAPVAAGPQHVTLETDGVRTTYAVAVDGLAVDVDSPRGHVRLNRVPRFVDPAEQVASGSLLAPMPGTVVSVAVEAGQQVEAGQPVLVLEAMKMQHTVSAPHAGTVTEIDVKPGAQVAAGEVLAVVEETE
ncbi:MAG: biotin/lipoyl-binding protein, partial [Actinomycetales bacterium]